MDTKNLKMLGAAFVVMLFAVYRLGMPYLESTKEINTEIEKIEKQIQGVRNEAAMFGKGWEDTMKRREADVALRLPDILKSSEVLTYFLSNFEQAVPGRVWFKSVDYQKAALSDFKLGTGGKAQRARSVRYKMKGELSQEVLVPFVQHSEKYPGLFRIDTFKFDVSKERRNALEMEISFEFYLTPREWVPPGALIADQTPDGDERKIWKALFVSNQGRSVASGSPTRFPALERIVGQSVVANENLYEEGDSISGWKVMRIDSRNKRVTLRWGSVLREVEVK